MCNKKKNENVSCNIRLIHRDIVEKISYLKLYLNFFLGLVKKNDIRILCMKKLYLSSGSHSKLLKTIS